MSDLKFIWQNHVIKTKTVRVPYGWKKPEIGHVERDDLTVDQLMSEDFGFFVVDYQLVPFIEKALTSLNNGTSLRDAANWLTVATGKPISHMGLKQLWEKVVVNPKETDYQARLDTWKVPKTREEKKRRTLVKRKAAAKRAVTVNQKKLSRLSGLIETNTEGTSQNELGLDSGSSVDTVADLPVEANVIFRPNPGPQTDFLAASEQEVLYGGSAGGGKSYAILADPMRYFYHPKFNGLIIRRTNDELRDLIRESRVLYHKAFPDTKFSVQSSTWTFGNGGTLWMSYLERDEDVMRYQGQAFSWIAVDELTQYATPYAWDYLRSRLRTTAKDLPLSMRATTNPGGPGHQWVKKMFIDPAPPGMSFIARDIETNAPLVYPRGHPREGQPLFKRKFIPARLKDNPYLYADGQYEASLLSLPEHQKRQLLEGDWSVSSGAAFPEFRATEPFVVRPFDIPVDWRRFRACDFGYSSHSAVLWFAIDPVWNRLIVYRELYVSKNTGKELAQKIVRIEQEAKERMSYGVLDSSVFHQRGNSGPVISEEMAAEGARFRPSDRGKGSRIAGRNRLHELLKLEEMGTDANGVMQYTPSLVIFDTCRQLISDLQVIPTDPRGGEDIDDRFVSDHTYDALRYGIMSRPKPHTFYSSFSNPTGGDYKPANNTFGY